MKTPTTAFGGAHQYRLTCRNTNKGKEKFDAGAGKYVPAPSSDFVTNGVNWTGNFNVIGSSFTVGKLWGKVDASIAVSKFSGDPFGVRTGGQFWNGYTIGFGMGLSGNPTKSTGIHDVIKILDKATFGVHQQYYYMLYGNGGDKLNSGKDVSGWNIANPIDPKDNQ